MELQRLPGASIKRMLRTATSADVITRTPAGKASVPLLVTMDLEIAPDHDLSDQHSVLLKLSKDLKRCGLPITVFCTVSAAETFRREVRAMRDDGHEIACHGLTHDAAEDYRRMSAEEINASIREATLRLGSILGDRPRCFRGPAMTTSVETQRALIENGYLADFSVCSQRLPFPATRGSRSGWLTAPRSPYRPSDRSPFRPGSLPLLVVPLSCLAAPFLSGMLYLTGLRPMKLFFRLLFLEAVSSRKPVVYAFHSYEFARFTGTRMSQPLVQRLYRRDRARRYGLHHALMRHISESAGVLPMTASQYVRSRGGREHA